MTQELSARQAAAVIGLSHTMIHRYVKQGILEARRVGRINAIKIQVDVLRRFAQDNRYDFNESLAEQYVN